MSPFELLAAPFAECLVLVGIHTYLGLHVLKRRVIFVDLALAQIAALGTTVGFLLGIMTETWGSLIFSMAFTFVGAAVFSITRFRSEKIPQEAVIGLTYAVACALAILVVEKTRGAEHLKDVLVGNLLWVRWSDVIFAAVVYMAVGGLHFLIRKKLFLISEDPEGARRAGVSVRFWDFIFYMTFGVVISLSTRVAGVLLVFVFLVAPAILAFMLTSRVWLQLLIGWGLGTVVTVGGLYLSWVHDLPSGPAVIGFYGATLVLGGIIVAIIRSENRPRTALNMLLGALVSVAIGLSLWYGGKGLAATRLASSDRVRQVERNIKRDQAEVASRRRDEQSRRRSVLAQRTRPCVAAGVLDLYLRVPDPEAQLKQVRDQMSTRSRRGFEVLLLVLADDETPLLYREEALEVLQKRAANTFGYDPQNEPKENLGAIVRICTWLATNPVDASPPPSRGP